MSDFVDSNLNSSDGIDFNKAQKLPGGGSTCDIYKAISQRRKVFVKRLKPKYRNMPLYLAAFDKEFDIGVSLNHKALPQYREFHEDYIVMDFIDGKTLGELIREKDQWLSKEKNVIRLLRELLEVVDYLHQHNIVHGDIKPDNIMITAGNRNLMLIDLDKCYTDWLDDTSGDPSKYEVSIDKVGDRSIDFHGIAKIVEILVIDFPVLSNKRLERFSQECKKENPSIDNLQELLAGKNNFSKIWFMVLPLTGLVISGMIIWRPQNNQLQAETFSSAPVKDTVVIYHKPSDPVESAIINEPPVFIAQNPKEIKVKSSVPYYIPEIEKEMPIRFAPMYSLMDKAEVIVADSLSSDDSLREIGFQMAMTHSDIMLESYDYFEKKFRDIDATDIHMAVAKCDAQKSVTKRWNDIQQRITDIIESRRKIIK